MAGYYKNEATKNEAFLLLKCIWWYV